MIFSKASLFCANSFPSELFFFFPIDQKCSLEGRERVTLSALRLSRAPERARFEDIVA